MGRKVVAVIGACRKGEVLDTAVEAILEGARKRYASTRMIYLSDRRIQFCTGCRECAQEPGLARGNCRQDDDLDNIVSEIEAADAVVLASPVTLGNASAVFRCFMERLIGCTYWPRGNASPLPRSHIQTLRAALVATTPTPGFKVPHFAETRRALRLTAKFLGARPVASLWIGFSATDPARPPSSRILARARRIGMKLV